MQGIELYIMALLDDVRWNTVVATHRAFFPCRLVPLVRIKLTVVAGERKMAKYLLTFRTFRVCICYS